MLANSTGFRLAVLAVAAACAMPFATNASHVRGGDDVPNCDTSFLDKMTICTTDPNAPPGKMCGDNKAACVACTTFRNTKTTTCGTPSGRACGGDYCLGGQENGTLNGKNCIQVGCP